MLWFKYRDILSTDMGIVLQKTPNITKPPIRYNTVTVDGMDGSLYEQLGYGEYQKPLSIGLKDMSKFDDIVAWLNGYGKLIISNESDKYYNAMLFDQVDYEKLKRFKTATLNFKVQPFKYAVNPTVVEYPINTEDYLMDTDNNYILDTDGNKIICSGVAPINYGGNIYGKPTINIEGTGTIIVIVNDVICELTDIKTDVTIDSAAQDCYDSTGKLLNRNMHSGGKFPTLLPGQNNIRIYGNYTQCKVVLNERWL